MADWDIERPLREQIAGQDAFWQQFDQALAAGRLPHAILLQGPVGIGKLAMAMAVAQEVNRLPDAPEKDKKALRQIAELKHPDIHIVYPIYSKKVGGKSQTVDDFLPDLRTATAENLYLDPAGWAASLGDKAKQLKIYIHDMRQLQQKVQLRPYQARLKVVMIWQADLMNVQAANAFLKLLEEPPDDTLLVLTIDSGSELLATISSRVQRYQLMRMQPDGIKEVLQTQFDVGAEQAQQAAHLADGSLTHALELARHTQSDMITRVRDWLRLCYKGDLKAIQGEAQAFNRKSKEEQQVYLQVAMSTIRNAALHLFAAQDIALESPADAQFSENFHRIFNPDAVSRAVQALEDAGFHLRRNANASMVFSSLSLRLHRAMRKIPEPVI